MNRAQDPSDNYDLSALAARLLAGWRLVAGLALAAAALALGLAVMGANRYRAEALLAVARPASLSFDPRFSETEASGDFPSRVGSLRTYPELAQSDGVALALIERHPELAGDAPAVEDLLDRVVVQSRAEGTLIGIEAIAASPEQAAALANAWAEIVTEQAAALFGSGQDLAAVTVERDRVSQELSEANEALASFDAEGGVGRIAAEVGALQSALQDGLATIERLHALQADLVGLRAQIAAGGADGTPLALAELQQAALGAAIAAPIELSLSAEALASRPASGQIEALAVQAEASLDAVKARVDLQTAQLAEAQAKLTRSKAERAALERKQALADERHLTVSRKADELAVAIAATRPELRLASPAAPSNKLPLGDWFRRALVAALLGALAGTTWLLWRPDGPR